MQRIIIGVDVGTTKICTIVARVSMKPSSSGIVPMHVLGVGQTESHGLDRGVVVDIEQAVHAIEASIEKAERLSGFRIGSAYVGIAGRHIASLNSRGVVAIGGPEQEIGPHDVMRAVEAARAIALPTQREVVHVIPRAYSIDGHEGIRDPVGMSGYRLEVETHIVTGEVIAIQNLIRCVQRSGVEIDDLVLQPLASGEAVLTQEEKERGVVLVDIGGGTTDIAVYVQGGIWHTSVLPVGGNHFTNDIVYVLHIPYDTAEYLKLRYGCAIAGATWDESPEEAGYAEGDDPSDDILDVDAVIAGEQRRVTRREVNEIVQARAMELVELIYEEIQRSGYEGVLPSGIVLTGGSAQLARLDELASGMLGVPVRVGAPVGLGGLADAIDAPPYATAVGLVRWGARYGAGAQSSDSSVRTSGSRLYERIKSWLREFLP